MTMNKPNQTTPSDIYYNSKEVQNTMHKSTIPTLLSAKEVSQILKIGYVKTLELMRYGKIPSVKLGNTYRTSETALAEWLSANLTA